ncbi:All-trans-nonaprenyl-diphosphate synthase (geranylgeranyl-diphosphate specific) [Bertholletia excelsa]
MLFSRGFSRIPRTINRCRWLISVKHQEHQLLSPAESAEKAMGCSKFYTWDSRAFHGVSRQIHQQSSSILEDQQDPFSLVENELSLLANRLRSMVVAEVPKLASAAEYFFKMGVEGKRFRPT